jgi:hypothetical protein
MLNNRPVRSSIFNLAFTCKPSAGVSAYAPGDTTMVALWAPW